MHSPGLCPLDGLLVAEGTIVAVSLCSVSVFKNAYQTKLKKNGLGAIVGVANVFVHVEVHPASIVKHAPIL